MGSPPVPARGLARAVNRESGVLYLLIFVTAVSQRTMVPLLPIVEHRDGLHPAAVAGVLVLPSLAMLVTAAPIGILGDRIGNRRVTLAAGALLGLAGLGQAVPSLLALVLARLAFGIGYGAMWTAGLAWLAGLRSGSTSRRLGATILASGVGSAVGPTVAGTLASHFGFATPFLVVGVASSAVAATLVVLARRSGPAPGRADIPPSPRAGTARGRRARAPGGATLTALRSPAVLTAAVSLVLASGVAALVQLLVPLQLDAVGRSAEVIGLVLSAGSVVYIATSAACVRLGPRVTNARTGAWLAALLGVALLPAVGGSSLPWVAAAVVCSALPRAAINTVGYALAADNRDPGGPGPAAVIGLLNTLTAVASVSVPLLAGGLGAVRRPTGVYGAAVLAIAAAAIGLRWLVRRRAQGGTRTRTTSRSEVFETSASADSATWAGVRRV